MLETLSEQRCHGGVQGFYGHSSTETGTPMRFAVYLPPAAERGPVPVLYYLAGLTCTEETAIIKAGAQAHARRISRRDLDQSVPDTCATSSSTSRREHINWSNSLQPYLTTLPPQPMQCSTMT